VRANPTRVELGERRSQFALIDLLAVQGGHLLAYLQRTLLTLADAVLEVGQSSPRGFVPGGGAGRQADAIVEVRELAVKDAAFRLKPPEVFLPLTAGVPQRFGHKAGSRPTARICSTTNRSISPAGTDFVGHVSQPRFWAWGLPRRALAGPFYRRGRYVLPQVARRTRSSSCHTRLSTFRSPQPGQASASATSSSSWALRASRT
jgi:hypothetical protein